ncbi:hypothetical protein BH10ACT11_BH10ACT11_11120 [soil metagenome]
MPHAELVAQRDQLASQFAELQWDLGGMAYEMAGRDHFRLDLIVRQAAKLQQVDSELGQAERMLALARGGATSTCPACGGLQARGAVFCWQCGTEQIAQATGSLSPVVPASPPPAQSSVPQTAAGAPHASTEAESISVSADDQPTTIQSQARIPGA